MYDNKGRCGAWRCPDRDAGTSEPWEFSGTFELEDATVEEVAELARQLSLRGVDGRVGYRRDPRRRGGGD